MTRPSAPEGTREDAAEDAKLDSGPRGVFSCVIISVCLSVCLFAGRVYCIKYCGVRGA